MSSTRLTAAEQRAAILRNARAAHREQVRNAVLRDSPGLSEAEVETEVRRRLAAVQARGGRTSQANRAAEIATARHILAAIPEALADAERATDRLRQLVTLAEAVA